MKRSEMVKILIDHVNEEDRITSLVLDRDSVIKIVLDKVEELGMLPPSVMEYIENGPGNSNTLCNEVNKWESECETPKCCGGGCHE